MTEPTPASLADRVSEGEIRFHELEAHADANTAAAARRRLVSETADADVDALGEYAFDAADAHGSNIENMVGAVQVPMGVAGPVAVDGGALSGERYLPMATTEGALVASINRGCSVVNDAGGATARVTKSGMTRAPIFRVADVAEAEALVSWVRDNEGFFEAAESTTSHGELLDVTPYVVGNNVYLRFRYDTKDAMGMNMVTIATREACDEIEAETDASLVALSGNLCSDKKPAAINAVEGRGRSVAADVEVPREVVEERLHTTPESIAEINTRKNLVGLREGGRARLQRPRRQRGRGDVPRDRAGRGPGRRGGANAITTAETTPEGDLYLSVSLASLEVGTVGGGTGLPTQAAGLDILGVRGGGDPAGSNGDALAEAIAVGALAGELSLLAALGSRHLSSAHADLGR